jgi:hypothetical protein
VAAVGLLVDGTGIDVAELYGPTSGNPFYVTEALQAGWATCRRRRADAVLARVLALGEDCREVLTVAALLGTRVDLPLLESVACCSPDAVDDLLTAGPSSARGRCSDSVTRSPG